MFYKKPKRESQQMQTDIIQLIPTMLQVGFTSPEEYALGEMSGLFYFYFQFTGFKSRCHEQ